MSNISNQPQDVSEPKDVTDNVTSFIKKSLKTWVRFDVRDTELWDTFRYDFKGYKEDDFKQTSVQCQRKLREFLRKRGVWVEKSKLTIARSLYNTLHEDVNPLWSEGEVRETEERGI